MMCKHDWVGDDNCAYCRAEEWRDLYEAGLVDRNELLETLTQARALVSWLPITTEELRRLRNANKITFDKQVNSITTCLIQLRECFAAQNRDEHGR